MTRLLRQTLIYGANALPMSIRRSIHNWPIIGNLQRKLFKQATQNCPLETYAITAGPARGLKLALCLPQEKSFWLGTFELPAAEAIADEVHEGDVCWDVGAYIGYFSAIMGRKSGREVVCFEPLPQNRDRLAMQASLNAEVHLKLMPVALGAESGDAEFLIMLDSSMGKLAQSPFQPNCDSTARIQIPIRTVDDVVSGGEALPPNFIKIDTEGAEYQVLTGAKQTLAKHRPRILLEYHGCDDDPMLLQLLAELAYRVTVVETGCTLSDQPVAAGQHLLCTPS